MHSDKRGRERQLVRVHLEELVDAVFRLAGRVPVGLLPEIVFVVLEGCNYMRQKNSYTESGLIRALEAGGANDLSPSPMSEQAAAALWDATGIASEV